MKEFVIKQEQEWGSLVPQILAYLGERKVLCLKGDLGAGKTTFVQYLGRHLGTQDEVTSPTFGIVNQYLLEDGGMLNHLDLYRLETLDEVLGIGFEEYLADDHLTMIEWPAIAKPLLDVEAGWMSITALEGGERKIVLL